MKTEIFEVKTGNSEKTIGDLRKELKAAKGDIANLTVGTEEYNAAVQKAADITDKLGDIQQLVQRSSTGLAGKMASVSNVMAGVSGAANTVVGTLSLLGVENEELNKKLNNSITALIGITQGLSALTPAGKALKELTVWTKAATKGFSSMKKALIGTGIGALVVAIGTLVAYKDDIREFFNRFNTGVNNIKESTKQLTDQLEAISSAKGSPANFWQEAYDNLCKYNKEATKTTDQIRKQLEANNIQYKNQLALDEQRLKKLQEEYDTKLKLVGIDARAAKEAKQLSGQITALKERVNTTKELLKENGALLLQYRNLKEEEPEVTTTVTIDKKQQNVFEGQLKKSADELVNVEKDAIQRTYDFLNSIGFSDTEIAEFANKMGNDFEKIRNYLTSLYGKDYIAYLLTGEEQPIKISVEPVLKPAAESTDSLVEQANEAAAKWDAEQTKKEEDAMKRRKKNYAESVQLVGSLGNAFAALSDVFAENEEASQALAISSIIADTAAAIMGTWAGYADLGIPGTIAAAIQTAAIAATGVAQIMNVKNQRISEGYTPNIPEVKTSAIQQSNYAGGEYKVYVTETDITNTQNRVRVIENQSKY